MEKRDTTKINQSADHCKPAGTEINGESCSSRLAPFAAPAPRAEMTADSGNAPPPAAQPRRAPPVPRYCDRPFPAYRYVPGRSPHPTRDAEGHCYGMHSTVPAGFAESAWCSSEEYLFGVDLFNHGYWWEAHEAWEGCWRAAGRDTFTGRFLQALIQTSAACLKKFLGQTKGMRLLAADALDKLPANADRYMGIPVRALRADIRARLLENAEGYPLIRLDNCSEFCDT